MFEEIVRLVRTAAARCSTRWARVAGADTTVLILGETGTGKELIARAIHLNSKAFEPGIHSRELLRHPSQLIASEFCSAMKRERFTGAVQRRIGRFEAG